MQQIDHYNIVSQIGDGSLCRVYHAYDTRYERHVALKVLMDDTEVENAADYIRTEAAILAMLDYPTIPTLYEFHDGWPMYLALEQINGADLEYQLKQRDTPFDWRDVVHWGMQLCAALTYLHSHEPMIVFRDLKTSHIMVDHKNDAWLLDFNLAKVMPPEKVLYNADKLGTEGYAAPELYDGTITTLVDIYGLGATLHHILNRRDPRIEKPFTFHETPADKLHLEAPPELQAVLLKAVAHEPEKRFPTADTMRQALQACL